MNAAAVAHLTTETALGLIAHGVAPTYPNRRTNMRVKCADGFSVSVQASDSHYCHDANGDNYHTRGLDQPPPVLPFLSFEIGYPSETPTPWRCSAWEQGYDDHADHEVCDGWEAYGEDGEGSSVYAYVPRSVVAALLDSHGGAVAWTDKS